MVAPSEDPRRTCWVASLKFAPIMWSVGRAIGEPVMDAGCPVRYLLSQRYDWMVGTARDDVTLLPTSDSANPFASLLDFWRSGAAAAAREAFRQDPPGTLVILNLNQFVDRWLVGLARAANKDVRVVVMLHEPYTADKLVYPALRALLLVAFERLTRGLVRRSDAVILPSANALAAYELYYGDLDTDARVIPLPLVDEACSDALDRRYVSFLGQIPHVRQKGLDLFLEMVESAEERMPDLQFQIVTGNDPSELLSTMSPAARDRLRVVQATPLTDATINRAMREALAVVVLQRRVMQSGVVPVAMMNGAPLIVSDLPGLTQFVSHGETGFVIPVEPGIEARFEAVAKIRDDLDTMSRNSRRYYEETFDSRQVGAHVPWLVGRATGPG